jgi:predicted aconitase with swiveling domain
MVGLHHDARVRVNAESEAIVAVGAIIGDIPMVDQVAIALIRDGDWVVVQDGVVEIHD